MRIITETELRDAWKQEPFTTYTLPGDMRLTPAARQFLTDWRIDLMEAQAAAKPASMKPSSMKPSSMKPSEADGCKPECCTHLNGRELVVKHHPRIRFRGLADSFYGFLVELELLAEEKKIPDLQAELRVLRKYAGQIMMAEVTGKELAFIDFNGWSPEEIRDRSHYPQKYYGIGHFRIHPKNGMVMVRLNRLRTRVREMEVAASEVFGKDAGKEARPDLILALNRFSSIAYILMCRLKSGGYEYGE